MVDAGTFGSGETNTRAASVLECCNVIDTAPVIHTHTHTHTHIYIYIYECIHLFCTV